MRGKAYPRYQSTDLSWLGGVPEHWAVKRGRFLIQVNPPAFRLRALGAEDEVSFVPMEAVGVQGGLNLEQTRLLADISSGYTEFQDGDVIVAKITPCFENGKAAYAAGLTNGAAYGTTELHVLRAGATIDRSFLFYVAISDTFRKLGESEMYGAGGQKRVPPEFCKNFITALPSLTEQRAIVAFLNRETGRIDQLVAKKRELIERLKEKRTALISRTVTRGLPPIAARAAGLPENPPLKPSGLEWIGDVPKHWGRANKLARFASRRKHSFVNGPFGSDLLTSEITDEGVPVIYIRDISAGHYRRTSEGCVTPEKAKELNFCRVDPGDVLIAKVGDPPGAAAIYPASEPSGIVTQDVIRIRVDESAVSASYVAYFLNSSPGRGLIDQIAIESTRMRVSLGDYKSSLCVIPPLPEQTAIAAYLDVETTKLDALMAKMETAIERLQEYRTALITAAVTGKIDVRQAAVA